MPSSTPAIGLVRAFVAVDPGPAVHTALVRLKNTLAAVDADVRWVGDGGLHVTLKFLGATAPASLDQLRAGLADTLRDRLAIPVHVSGLGAFPSRNRPRVVWVGVTGDGLDDVARAVETAAVAAGFPAEERPFRPHITLGRVRGPRGARRLETALGAQGDADCGAGVVNEVIAYRSDLHRTGAVYTKLWTIPLVKPTEGDSHGHGR